MQTDMNNLIHHRYKKWVRDHSLGVSKSHSEVLAIRQEGLSRIAEVLNNEVQTLTAQNKAKTKPLYERNWLETFATGDIIKCLGNDFIVYKDRRCPRIPNGDFLLISRIMQIKGRKGIFNEPAHITAEYDVPTSAWFFDGAEDGRLPVSILLEIALQPCGVLTAWLGTQLRFPEINYFFRNLDGDVKLLKNTSLRGKTIKTYATLTRTVFSGTIIIQHFDIELAVDDVTILQGTSSFGYFPDETMSSQGGLDGGKSSKPWGLEPENSTEALQLLAGETPIYPNCPTARLKLTDEVNLFLGGGKYGKGYAMAYRKNSADDWFYVNHFYEDPVMPGSLGIESIFQALKALAHAKENSDCLFILAKGASFTWQYRGQILPTHRRMWVDVHLIEQKMAKNEHTFIADASLWADDMRIYNIHNLAIEQIQESKK